MSIAAKGFLVFPVISPLCQVWETPTAAPALSSVLYDSLDFRIRLFRIDVSSKYLPSGDVFNEMVRSAGITKSYDKPACSEPNAAARIYPWTRAAVSGQNKI